ncbi:MAG: alpha/beta hydrolase family protein [Solirubrobacteraceae bacterium]
MAVGVLAAPVGVAASASSPISCRGDGVTPQQISVDVGGQPDSGFYVAPTSTPRGLVIFSHGHTASPVQWFPQMARVAQRDGLIAVAMYNPGESILGDGSTTFGWRVREGAQAGIAAAQAVLAQCKKLEHSTIVNYGVSMGGNTSGLMAAAAAKRERGRPLFDYWFDVEGVTNVIETYTEATLVAQTGNATGAQAKQEIEQENNGTPVQQPVAYKDLAVVSHGTEIAASGVKGVVLVHGVDDGTVPYNQSLEMEASLIQAGVPTDFYTVATSSPGTESGSTLDGLLPVPHQSPFAGHGGEGSQTQLVIQTGLDSLDALYQHDRTPVGHRNFVVDGTTGQTVPPPG